MEPPIKDRPPGHLAPERAARLRRPLSWLLEAHVDAERLGRFTEAEACYHEALRLMPDYAGAAEVVRALKDAGFLLGVCSNKPVAFTRQGRASSIF